MTNYADSYTNAELKLIRACSLKYLNLVKVTDINPTSLYDMLAIDMFVGNVQGPHIDALRRAVGAIHSCNPYRWTPEFDKLCEFEETNEN